LVIEIPPSSLPSSNDYFGSVAIPFILVVPLLTSNPKINLPFTFSGGAFFLNPLICYLFLLLIFLAFLYSGFFDSFHFFFGRSTPEPRKKFLVFLI